MIAVDTNVVVRLITADDSAQSGRAVALFERTEIFVGLSVLVETDWVLRSKFGFSRNAVANAFARLCGLLNVSVEQADVVARAIEAHREGLAFADAVHLLAAEAMHAAKFATFDEELRKRGKSVARSILVVAP